MDDPFPPFDSDPVAIALGFVPGKKWPDDDSRPGPYYWRVVNGEREEIHRDGCAVLAAAKRALPWFAAIGKPPEWASRFLWADLCAECFA